MFVAYQNAFKYVNFSSSSSYITRRLRRREKKSRENLIELVFNQQVSQLSHSPDNILLQVSYTRVKNKSFGRKRLQIFESENSAVNYYYMMATVSNPEHLLDKRKIVDRVKSSAQQMMSNQHLDATASAD